MPLTCLTCRKITADPGEVVAGACPDCGGDLVESDGAWLEWKSADGERGREVLCGQHLSIGRRSLNDLVLKDGQVSKNHAALVRTEQDWYIRDGCSVNGTFVNSEPVKEQLLCDGDLIGIGNCELCFHSRVAPACVSGITIIPRSDLENTIQASLACEPWDFKPACEVPDHAELRADYQRLLTVHQFNTYMGRERDEQVLLQNILKFSFENLPADRGAILLREEEGAPLVPALVLANPKGPAGQRSLDGEIVIPDSILKRAVDERTAVLSADATADLRFQRSHSVVSESIRSAMCVPLVGRNEVLGAVHLDTKERTSAFQLKDLQLLSTLAGQAASVLERSRLQRKLDQEANTRRRLSRFLARELLEEVVERGLELSSGGRTAMVTVLFCDIRGFSALAESMEPKAMMGMLNAFFERMVDVVFRHGGMLDKFIGDALMAVWGAPLKRQNDAERALLAGRDMRAALVDFNREGQKRSWPRLAIGVGVNTGEAFIGAIGSSRRMEYTVMGDTVNLASRICDLAGKNQILLTEATRAEAEAGGQASIAVQPLAQVKVRGRQGPVKMLELSD